MLPLFSRAEIQAVDRQAVDKGIPSIVLMENAGRGATDQLCAHFPDHLGQVLLLGGPGQNGGDAWVVARHLHLRGVSVQALLIGKPGKLSRDAASNWKALAALGIDHAAIESAALNALEVGLDRATLVVDGLFGIGLDREVKGVYRDVIERLNSCSAPKVALDIPSGIDANTGQVLGIALRADLSVTFAGHKRGLHQYPGVEYAGTIALSDIGVPAEPLPKATLLSARDLNELLPKRAGDAHKGDNGHLLVVGGSPGKTGAALLSAHAAFRAGAGLVTLGARVDAHEALEQKVVEAMTIALPNMSDANALQDLEAGKGAIVLGPGFGLDELARVWVEAIVKESLLPVVIDADALSIVAELGLSALKHAKGSRILTPHPGEAARLLNSSSEEVQRDRYAAALELATQSAQVVVLKGARSVVATPEGTLSVCAHGTPALGVAGSGDVLAGIIAALVLTQPVLRAAQAGVLLHALAAECIAAADRGLLAHEVADALPEVLAAHSV